MSEEEKENIVPASLTEKLNEIKEQAKTEEVDTTDDGSDADAEVSDKEEAVIPEKTSSEAEADEEQEQIDPRLVAAARRRGWSDEKIVRIAETDETILEDMANLMDDLTGRETPAEPTEKAEKEPEKISKVNIDDELEKLSEEYGDDVVTKVIRPLTEKLNANTDVLNEMKGVIDELSQGRKVETDAENVRIANKIFDEEAETYPAFGQTKDLPRTANGQYDTRSSAYKEREAVFDTAVMFMAAKGMSFNSAMREALTWYAGKSKSANVESSLIKKLNARKKKFSPRPTRRKGEHKVYASKDEEKRAVIAEAKKKAGITV